MCRGCGQRKENDNPAQGAELPVDCSSLHLLDLLIDPPCSASKTDKIY